MQKDNLASAHLPRSRLLLALGSGLAAVALSGVPALAAAPRPRAIMHKTPTCGCCNEWAKHMREAGFEVEAHETEDLGEVKQRLGVPADAYSCHTVEIGNYILEGHVPAVDVQALLDTAPAAWGLAVPGMPPGSPGMGELEPGRSFEVLLIGKDGSKQVFSTHTG